MSKPDTRRVEFLIRHLKAHRLEPWPISFTLSMNGRCFSISTEDGYFEGKTFRQAFDRAIERKEREHE